MRIVSFLLVVTVTSMLFVSAFSSQVKAEDSLNPGSTTSVTAISDVLNSPEQFIGQNITVSGTIIYRIKGNDFLLQDKGNSLVVDCGPIWYHDVELEAGLAVEVQGQAGYAGPPWARSDDLEIDACLIRYNDTEVEIRSCDFTQPPPWAGGPFRHSDAGFPREGDNGRGKGPPWAGNGSWGQGPPWCR